MDPATPKKQKSPGVSTPVEAMPESRPQSRSADISTSDPTTPDKQKTQDVSVIADTALESQSVTVTGVITPRGHGSPFRNIDHTSPTLHIDEFTRYLIVEWQVHKLTTILRALIVRSGLVIGCKRSYHTCFTPPMAEIREKLSSFPDLDAKYMVDVTANWVLTEWEKQCRYVIQKYQNEMHRDLVKDAKKESDALKPDILEAVEAKVRAFEQYRTKDESRPTTPTPTARAPPSTPTVDDINDSVGGLGIMSPLRLRNLGKQEFPRLHSHSRTHQGTPKSTPRLTAPARFYSPQSQRSRNKAPMTPRPGTPGGSPLKTCIPLGHEDAGMSGPHHVLSPVHRAGPPPKFNLNVEV
ncbi:hypothetical protein FHL15_006944 [Xylaria flabelliformis]|uniref:Uncharacterized protein n=1 Tax=Xylaria flabelliformis TaxID=2512241 RepID=A0A553HVW6_9PEZI|nr:hypothetical protein FHL15_006944 [Xylaria flabelliformis]